MIKLFLLVLGMANQTELYSGPIRRDVPTGVEVKKFENKRVGVGIQELDEPKRKP